MIEKISNLILKEISDYKIKNKISQKEMAGIIGVPEASFNNIIAKLKRNIIPSNTTLNKIEKVLKNK